MTRKVIGKTKEATMPLLIIAAAVFVVGWEIHVVVTLVSYDIIT